MTLNELARDLAQQVRDGLITKDEETRLWARLKKLCTDYGK